MAISESSGVITYRSAVPLWARVFIGLIGLTMTLFGPATMISIAAPAWSWSFALTVFTGSALFLFGIFALFVSVSAAITLEFRIAEHKLFISRRGPLGNSLVQHDFAEVSEPTFEMRDSEDGAYPVLTLRLGSKRSRLEMTGFVDADEARRWQRRLTEILAVSS